MKNISRFAYAPTLEKNIFTDIDSLQQSVIGRVFYIVKFLAVNMLNITNEKAELELGRLKDAITYQDLELNISDIIYIKPYIGNFRKYFDDEDEFDYKLLFDDGYDAGVEIPEEWLYISFEKKLLKQMKDYRENNPYQPADKIKEIALSKLTDKEKAALGY